MNPPPSREESAAWQDVDVWVDRLYAAIVAPADETLRDALRPIVLELRAADAADLAATRAALTQAQQENKRLQDLLDFQQGNYEDVNGDDLWTPEQMAEMQASFNAFVARREEHNARAARTEAAEASLQEAQRQRECEVERRRIAEADLKEAQSEAKAMDHRAEAAEDDWQHVKRELEEAQQEIARLKEAR